MFQIGDTVVCGSSGVCTVSEIGPLAMMGKASAGRRYYTLTPCYDNGGKVYLPVDSDKSAIRPILTKAEADGLVSEIETLEGITIDDEKNREYEYKTAVNSSDPRRLICIIKTMTARRKSRLECGKKSTAVDERYFRIAEQRLCEEIALAMELDKEDVREYLREKIG